MAAAAIVEEMKFFYLSLPSFRAITTAAAADTHPPIHHLNYAQGGPR